MTDQAIPRYMIKANLGSGNMAVVYLALDRLTQQVVALKVLKTTNIPLNADFSLASEFRIMASLRHPHIVPVRDYGFTSQRVPYFIMDYLPDAQTFVQAGQGQSLDIQIRLVLQLLEGLAYLHRRGILHHDLKPGNILVVNNMVQVVDFGLSRLISRDQAGPSSGTLAYMPPEVLKKQSMTARGELFSVGILAYEMLKGAYPFPLSPAIAMINGILNTDLDFSQFGLPDRVVAILQKLVMKTPEDRYQSAQAVIDDLREALGLQQTDDRIPIRESYLQAASFVGRQTELDQLQTALSETQQGHNQVWLLGGESGVGKTRLVDEFRVQALIQGFEVLTGLAVEGGGLPFQVWREPVRRLLLSRPVDDLQAAILKEIVPDIEQLLDRPVATIPPLEGAAHQERLIFSIIDLLRYQQTSLLFILEDLQWAIESLEIIKQVLKVSDQIPRMMLLGTYRNDERPDLPQELPGVHILALDRLPDDAVNQLSQAILGKQGADPQLLSTLIQETEGNTFFIVEVMRAWAEEAGQLQQIGDRPLSSNIITTSMHTLLQRRVEHVPPGDQRLLQVAAIVGRELDLHIMEIFADNDINRWLQQALDSALLTINEDRWLFAHDKLRETILTDLDDEDRRQLHQEVAEAIEVVYSDNQDYYPILLEHWYQAGYVDRHIHYLNRVAEYLVQVSNYYEGVQQLLLRGLQKLDNIDYRRIALLNWLSESHWRQGQFDSALHYAQQAKELALLADNQSGLSISLYNLAKTLYYLGEYEDSNSTFLRCLDVAEQLDDSPRIALALKGLGDNLMNAGQFAEAEHFLSQSLEAAQQSEFLDAMVFILISLGELALLRGAFEQAHESIQQCYNITQRLGTRHGTVICLAYFGMIARNQKCLKEAYKYYQQGLEMAQEIDNQHMIAHIHRRLGLVEYDLGNYHQAYDLQLRSLEEMKAINDQWTIVAIHNDLGFTCLRMGDTQAASSFHIALTTAWSMQITPLVLEGLVGFAWLYLHNNKPNQAAELAGLAQHHPGFTTDVQLRLDELIPELEQAFDPADLQAALDQGKALDLETVVSEILTDDA